MANKFKCNKCGLESEMIPKEHGYFENAYSTSGKPTTHKKCSGEFALKQKSEDLRTKK